ncbi:hypothetical protein [Tateyamaria sp. Alg231-49]|uniref:hypothetical protein n=1 Tax=Tateyamaria sp. Alg231-49 TaxID=1922219 RepID=UPI000D555AE6|nr:hypothetical protein [Tateyamaria sp. Alg231-49]
MRPIANLNPTGKNDVKKKLALIVLGLSLTSAAYLLGMPWWSYGFGLLPTLIGLAWLGAYDSGADRSGGRGEMGQGS